MSRNNRVVMLVRNMRVYSRYAAARSKQPVIGTVAIPSDARHPVFPNQWSMGHPLFKDLL